MNAYTIAIEKIHAPSSAVENALKYAKSPAEGRRRLRPVAIAAAIAAAVLGTFLIYGVYIAPKSQIILDSRESVTITLNSRGNVLSAQGYPALGGKTEQEAIETVIEEMIGSDALTKEENTVIIGVSGNSDTTPGQLAEYANDVFDNSGFDGCTIAIVVDTNTQTQRRKSATQACIINLLNTYDPTLSVENLSGLSTNELGLLLVSRVHSGDIVVTGAPSESAYIGFDGAMQKALRLSGFRENELSDISVTYSVYHGRLIYLVRLNAGENSEAYFINAISGATEQAVKASAEEIDRVVKEAIGKPSPAQQPTQEPTYAAVTPSTAPFTEMTVIPDEAHTDNKPPVDEPTEAQATERPEDTPTTSPQTQAATAAESATYKTVPVTLKELSFVVASPPDSAKEIGYQTLFEGQYLEDRRGERINVGEMAVIANSSQLKAFLGEHDYAYTDKNGHTLSDRYDSDYFKTHYILASACTVSDASYYTTVTRLSADGGNLYTENSLSYGAARSGDFYCRTLSLYGVSRSAGIPQNLTVY